MADLDARIEAAAANIGKKPPFPPTWRGRFGSWASDLLRGLLGWDTAPIQQTFDLLNHRNREQDARLAQLQEQMLSLVDGLEKARMQTVEWLNQRNREQSARLAQVQEQMLLVLDGLRQARIQTEQSLRRQINELKVSSAESDALRADLTQHVAEVARAVWGWQSGLEPHARADAEFREALAREAKGDLEDLRAHIAVADSLRAEMAERASEAAHAAWERLSALETQLHAEARAREAGDIEVMERKLVKGRFASLYAEFEDVFRGPRDEIKHRLKVYVPWLERAAVGSASAPVLDLGCGRGEWLELLAERNFTASGVDSNLSMIGRCRALSLEVTQTDALTHLRSLPDQSVGAITSFHMIEHLPLETLITIVDEALRVLRSGGLLIFETPNVQNLRVGSQSFWIDPTHLQPMPSQTLRFLLEARGFRQVEILDLQPYPEAERLPEKGGAAQWVNKNFYGPRDYGVIGRRP